MLATFSFKYHFHYKQCALFLIFLLHVAIFETEILKKSFSKIRELKKIKFSKCNSFQGQVNIISVATKFQIQFEISINTCC